jgi:ketosteroid isomerase-like protein
MSQENVEIVRGFFDATERAIAAYWENPRSLGDAMKTDDLDPESKDAWKSLHPDVVWNTGDFGTYRGRLEIAVAWDDLFEVADDYRTAVRELTDCGGDRVFAAVDRTITAKGSGIHTTIPVFAVITVRDRRIMRVDEYLARGQALQAAGLRE